MQDSRHTVYVLRSVPYPDRCYTGLTAGLAARVAAHNAGLSTHTATGRPWHVVVSIEFDDAAKAEGFERYLKSGSGRAFAARHFR